MHENSNIIEVSGLTKRFGEFIAVDNVSFAVCRGETTTIRMMTTLLVPSKGEILLNGINPLENQNAARKSFGIVFHLWDNRSFSFWLWVLVSARFSSGLTRAITSSF